MEFDYFFDIAYIDNKPGPKENRITVEFHPHSYAATTDVRNMPLEVTTRAKGLPESRERVHFNDVGQAWAYIYAHSSVIVCVYRPAVLGKPKKPHHFDGMKRFTFPAPKAEAVLDALEPFVTRLERDLYDVAGWTAWVDSSVRFVDGGIGNTPSIYEARLVDIVGPDWGIEISYSDSEWLVGTFGNRKAMWSFLAAFKLSGCAVQAPEQALAA